MLLEQSAMAKWNFVCTIHQNKMYMKKNEPFTSSNNEVLHELLVANKQQQKQDITCCKREKKRPRIIIKYIVSI